MIVSEFKGCHIERQVDPSASSGQALGHPTERSQVGAQQTERPLGGVDMHVPQRVLARSVGDDLMLIAGRCQEIIDAILVGVYRRSALGPPLQQGAEGPLLQIALWEEPDLPLPLHDGDQGDLVAIPIPTSSLTLQATTPGWARGPVAGGPALQMLLYAERHPRKSAGHLTTR